MDKALFRSVLPYVVGLAIAVALYLYAGTIEYSPRPGQLGSGVSGRELAIVLMARFLPVRDVTAADRGGTRTRPALLEAFDRKSLTPRKSSPSIRAF